MHGATGHDHKPGQELAGIGLQSPQPLGLVPAGLGQLVVQPDQLGDAKFLRCVNRIGLDLWLLGKQPAPARVRRK